MTQAMNLQQHLTQKEYLKRLYSNRFKSARAKIPLWQILIKEFLQNYINPQLSVLDIGGGYCEFINNIRAKEKYLIDLNPDAESLANSDVQVFNLDILSADAYKLSKKFDIIFMSNFLEHLNSKEEIIKVLVFCVEHLNLGGSLLIIQPNFKYCYKEYYDFIDHQMPITHLSLEEILTTIGYKIDVMIPRFLPYTTKGKPTSPFLLHLYLKMPFVWPIFGAQMFVKAVKQ